MKTEAIEYEGKKVGDIIDGIIYVSHRSEKKHLFRGGLSSIPEAKRKKKAMWGIDYDLMNLLKMKGVQIVVIFDFDHEIGYWASLKRIYKDGSFLDMGHGLQKFLPLHEWRTTDDFTELVNAVHKVAA